MCRPHREYLVLGWEDFANSCLLFPEGSLAVPYKRRYVKKIKVRVYFDYWLRLPSPPAGSVLLQ